MAYIYPIPVGLVFTLVYIVSEKWDLKIFAKISKLIVAVSILYFLITYASFLGYNIPVVSEFCNNLVK